MASTGTVQTILVCVPSSFAQAPCPAGTAVSSTQAYVLDPSQQANYEAVTAPFDYAAAAGIWGMVFTFVIGLYLVSKSVGIVLNRIKR